MKRQGMTAGKLIEELKRYHPDQRVEEVHGVDGDIPVVTYDEEE